ncbi:MAG: hypothetical protein NTV93_16695 [Verrucomicrobia bacterium]|nr:hypothetical protein [Verrucomicrobiota bacterium]
MLVTSKSPIDILLYNSFLSGNMAEAKRIQFKLLELIKTMFAAGNFPEGFREGVNLRGFNTGRGPQPMSPHEMEHFNAIRSKLACLLKECGFAEQFCIDAVGQSTTVLPGEVKFHQKCLAPGARSVEYEITLPNDKPYVDLRISIDKLWETAAEACYVAFPFALPNAQPRYQTAGAIVRPQLDQLPGSNQDFHTAQQWVDFSNDKCGVTVTTADAPIAMFGGFHFARMLDGTRPKMPPLFLSMAMCNYWHTNYAGGQLGTVTFHYRIYPHAAYDAAEANRIGLEACFPLLSHPVTNPTGSHPPEASLVRLSHPAIVPLAIKPSEDGKSIVLRLFNPLQKTIKTRIAFSSRDVREIWACDNPENPQIRIQRGPRGFPISIPAGTTLTYRTRSNPYYSVVVSPEGEPEPIAPQTSF